MIGGSTASARTSKVPLADQQVALCILLELAIQRGSLSHILDSQLLLLNLWSSSRHDCDNRVNSNLMAAPLMPMLRRFQGIQSGKGRIQEMSHWDEVKFSRNFFLSRKNFETLKFIIYLFLLEVIRLTYVTFRICSFCLRKEKIALHLLPYTMEPPPTNFMPQSLDLAIQVCLK